MQVQMTLGDLRRILSQIGTGHDAKPIAILKTGLVFAIDANDVTVQGDRVLLSWMPIPKTKIFTMHLDPGHGWLAVNDDDLRDVDLDKTSFSKYSYWRNGTYYLEEDCDATKFVQAYRAKHGCEPAIRDSHSNSDSPIRRYTRLAG